MPEQIKERPILFSGAMVRAILDGTKTQTRRIVKISDHSLQLGCSGWRKDVGHTAFADFGPLDNTVRVLSPYGWIGDRLWVRETWNHAERTGYDAAPQDGRPGFDESDPDAYNFGPCWFRATDDRLLEGGWKPSIFMPRAASRITLEINNEFATRVERLQDISEADAMAEGSKIAAPLAGGWWFPESFETEGAKAYGASYKYGYQSLWESINGPGSWDANPWVWVVEFRKLEPEQ
jgi:hypothetical protein